jgi:hypothetical protein
MPSEKKRIETIDVYWETNFFMSGIVWTWGRMGGKGGEGEEGGGRVQRIGPRDYCFSAAAVAVANTHADNTRTESDSPSKHVFPFSFLMLGSHPDAAREATLSRELRPPRAAARAFRNQILGQLGVAVRAREVQGSLALRDNSIWVWNAMRGGGWQDLPSYFVN